MCLYEYCHTFLYKVNLSPGSTTTLNTDLNNINSVQNYAQIH